MKNYLNPFGVVSKKSFLAIVIFQIAFFLFVWFKFGSVLIPSPLEVINAIILLLSSSTFYENLAASLIMTAKAMLFSSVIALFFSYGYFIQLMRPLTLFLLKFRFVPLSGLIFLFTLLTSNGSQLKLWLLIAGIVPFFCTSLVSALESINTEEYDLCKTLRMNDWQMWLEVVIVGRMDQVIETMRQNSAITWLMIAMIEGLSMSEGGLGVMLIKTNRPLNLSMAFALLTVIFIIGLALDFGLGKLRSWFFPYTDDSRISK